MAKRTTKKEGVLASPTTEVTVESEVQETSEEENQLALPTMIMAKTNRVKVKVLTSEANRFWEENYSTLNRLVQPWRIYTDVPKRMLYYLAKKVGRPLIVEDLLAVAPIEEPAVQSYLQVKGVNPLVKRVSVHLLDTRNFDQWPELSGVVTPEYVALICQKWPKGHLLAGMLKRLGHYHVFPVGGVLPVHGRLFMKSEEFLKIDFENRSANTVEHWDEVWVANCDEALGLTTMRLRDSRERNDISPMPEVDAQLMLKQIKAFAARKYQQVKVVVEETNEIEDQLDQLFGGADDRLLSYGGGRSEKSRFQGGRRC